MADIAPSKFDIDSTMEYVSDQFQFDKPGTALARAASISDRVTLRTGLLDGSNVQQLVTAMSNAIIDEYEITFDPTGIVEHIRGRDAGAALLDLTYKQLYRRSPVTEPISQVPPPLGTPVVPEQIGRFMASTIARDACLSVGLGLSWGCRDYEMLSDFSASGRVIDLLRTLTQPWNLVAPFKIDIYIQNNTVMIAPRAFPFGRIDFSTTLKNAKRSQVTIRKRPTRQFGLVTLRGQKLPNSNVNGQGTPQPTNKNFSVSYPPAAPVGGERIAYDIRYRLPDNVMLYEQRSSFAKDSDGNVQLISRITTNKDWTSVRYDSQGRPLTPAQQISELTTTERVDPSDDSKLLRVWETTSTSFGYDSDGFVNNRVTIKQDLQLDTGDMNNSEMTIMDIVNTGPLLNDTTTTIYKWQEVNLGAGETQFQWVFQRSDVSPTGGHKPGGPGRGQPTSITIPNPSQPSPSQGGSTQIILTKQFLANGLDVSYSNDNLTMADLQFILNQFTAANSIWEYEAEFSGVAQTWLQRGSTIQFTDVFLEDGVTQFPLPIMLITEVRSLYDESKSASSALYKCRAFGYASS